MQIGKVIDDPASRGLKPVSEVQVVQKGRFPAFAVGSDTPMMDANLVQRVLDQEGF